LNISIKWSDIGHVCPNNLFRSRYTTSITCKGLGNIFGFAQEQLCGWVKSSVNEPQYLVNYYL